MPLVSVVVPTHNRPEFLAEALASIRAQTFTDYEIIVVSNGEGPEMRGRSQTAATLHEARYFAIPDGNVSAARNFGIERAKAEWIAFLDDDDVWLPKKLERHLSHTDADMTISDYLSFSSDGREEAHSMRPPLGSSVHRSICHGRWMPLPTVTVVRKSVLAGLGGFDPAFRWGEDGEIARRIAWRHEIKHIPEVLNRRRVEERDQLHLRANYRGEIRLYLKMLRDTPHELASDIPSIGTFARRAVIRYSIPYWMRQPRKQFRYFLGRG